MLDFEGEVFAKKRFVRERLAGFGFVKAEDGWLYEADLGGGDFLASVLVRPDGSVKGRVTDKIDGEEYVQLRAEDFCGTYTGRIRDEYKALLEKIAAGCCEDVLFRSDQANRIVSAIKETYGTPPDFPFNDGEEEERDYAVFRHTDNRKWFALFMTVRRGAVEKTKDERPVDIVNLKTKPRKDGQGPGVKGVYPAYHMNHVHWISVLLDGTLKDGDVMDLIGESFALTAKKEKK